MAELVVPAMGLALGGLPDPITAQPNESREPIQVMTLDLADGVFDDLLKCARYGGKPISISFGKKIVCAFGRDALPTMGKILAKT